MESIEKLRKMASNMDSFLASGYVSKMCDEIEAEIAERYMELPVDADGVPIHVGDSIEYPNGGRDVVRFITVNDNMPTFNESGWIASKCRHVKPRTLEDVLRDVWKEALDYAKSDMWRNPDEVFTERADEIRELLGGDAE